MPRKNAGHTGAASRNPGGRGSDFPGEKKLTSFYLTLETRDQVKALAVEGKTSGNAFVEGLIRRYGPAYAADLHLAADSLKGQDAEANGELAGGTADPGDVPAVRP